MTNSALFDLTGRRAVVTGASRGIGRAITLGYAAAGAHVYAVARSQSGLDETRALGDGLPGSVTVAAADMTSADAVDRAVAGAVDALGGIDILVNNAGYDNEETIEQTSDEEWHKVLDLNVTAAMRLSRAAAPHLKEGGGKVVNIASMFGIVTVRGEFAYTVSKHAIVGMTRSLAVEWARKGVQVNAIAPGFIETDMLTEAVADEATAAFMRRQTPMGRWAQPEELIGAAVFLAAPASDYMTGQLVAVDGGYTTQ